MGTDWLKCVIGRRKQLKKTDLVKIILKIFFS